MIYITDYWALNEVGRVCKMAGHFEANSRPEADKIAERTGHTIIFEASEFDEIDDGMGSCCDEVQWQRDEDWLEGQT